jgi:cell division transport system ATP-binding protein
MAVVELQHITMRYGSGAPVLSDISLTIEPSGLYFLTGATAAGKSTLLNIISLGETPTSGKLSLFGTDAAVLDRAARAAMRRRIGILFQDLRLLDALSVRDNVALPLRIGGVAEPEIRENVSELLAWVGLAERGDARAATLSQGERRRVAVARAIAGRPDLLLADEPCDYGDDEIPLLLARAFEWLNQLGAAVIVGTREIAFARHFTSRLRFHLDRGALSDAGAAPAQ